MSAYLAVCMFCVVHPLLTLQLQQVNRFWCSYIPIISGVHLEGPFISQEKKGAHPIEHIKTFQQGVPDLSSVYGNLDEVAMFTLAPELDHANDVIKHLVSQGITVSLGEILCWLHVIIFYTTLMGWDQSLTPLRPLSILYRILSCVVKIKLKLL